MSASPSEIERPKPQTGLDHPSSNVCSMEAKEGVVPASPDYECESITLDNRGLTSIYIRSRMLRRRDRSRTTVALCGWPLNRLVKATCSANVYANPVQGADDVDPNVTEYLNFRNRILHF
jgi:hypothetical protein